MLPYRIYVFPVHIGVTWPITLVVGQKLAVGVRNLIYERVGLVRLGRLVWFLFLETKYWRSICPPCASQVRLPCMLAQMPKKIINLFICYNDTLNCTLTIV
jgi:hypothetical protein